MTIAGSNIALKSIPEVNDDMAILFFLKKNNIDSQYLSLIKEVTSFNDDVIAEWLSISEKTLRTYRKSDAVYKENFKEHVVLLLSLYKFGEEVFGSFLNFDKWLNSQNVFFDLKYPKDFISTVSGIRFIYERLIAIEYGDNV